MRGLPLSLLVMGLALGCVPNAKSGDSGGDWGEGDGWGGGVDGGSETGTCEDSLRITGNFQMGSAEFPIDERIGEGLTFATEHKIDVDLFEAGCISDITLEIKQGGQGCKIDLEFEATGGGEFALSSFSFTADSYCPNFSDDLEGEYTTMGSVPLTVSGLPSQVEMETGTEETVCLDDIDFRFGASGTLQLAGSETERAFDLFLNLNGDYWSTGSTEAECEVPETETDADDGSDGGAGDGGADDGGADDGGADDDDPGDGGAWDGGAGDGGADDGGADDGDPGDGRTLFETNCTGCHGGDITDLAPDLEMAIPALNDAELKNILENGTGYMPAPDLNPEEEDLVFSYLRDLFGEFGGSDGGWTIELEPGGTVVEPS